MVEANGGGSPEDIMNSEYEETRESIDWVALMIGTLLCVIMLWCSGNISFLPKSKPPPREEDDRETPWTIEEVNRFDGKGPDGKIYIACNGFVFDVTESENYQEGGDY